MKAVLARLNKLEQRFSPPADTFEMQRLRERLEAARRRVAGALGERPNPVPIPRDWGITEILLAGRQRARDADSRRPAEFRTGPKPLEILVGIPSDITS
jgi:hypothetical protein